MQEQVKAQTQEVLDRRGSGVSIVSASIMAITLDRSVAQAFQDVANAMSDREKMINEARAYQNNLIPKARGDARTLLSEAEAYKQQRIAEAVGGASRFLSLQKEYEKGPRHHQDQALSRGRGEDPARGCGSTSSIPIKGVCRCILE